MSVRMEEGKVVVNLGSPAPMNPLHEGEIRDGGFRIRVWSSWRPDWQNVHKPRVTVSRSFHGRKVHGDDGPVVEISGADTITMNSDQAEALVAELQLALAAIAESKGEIWAGREIAPGLLRAPKTSEKSS